jgi:segregation and condensation protein A
MHDKIISIISNNENITWQTMILELIKNQNMDPWDLDIGLLSRDYIKIIKKMKELDLFISGKMLLCAAYLLRIKSVKLVDDYISEFDKLLAEAHQGEETLEDDFYSGLENAWKDMPFENQQSNLPEGLIPRTPQPRKRKVSVYDLMEALQKAIEVSDRKVLRELRAPTVVIPDKRKDITLIIKELYSRIKIVFGKKDTLTFSELIPSNSREDIIATFVPLLHLSHHEERKISLDQKEHFGEIGIKLV